MAAKREPAVEKKPGDWLRAKIGKRVLRPGGRYGIHGLCVVPDDVGPSMQDAIRHERSDGNHVGVRPRMDRE